ncbi:MAG: rhomboid family intramembrane serine protease [Luteitalea sp.]|nr:rhomboid family intramembrane serine protease [Luteitalea sp.]
MIPIRDLIPTQTTPWVTWTILAANVLVYFVTPSLDSPTGELFLHRYGLVPQYFTIESLLTSMFVHGGLAHLFGNMLYLWIFGDNVEDRIGHVRFIVFYLLCGTMAALVQTIIKPDSLIPMVGASGAISGVLGAYLVLFPRARVLTLVPLFVFVTFVEIPAVILLGLWFLYQLLVGVGTLASVRAQDVGGVAFWAHTGGFAAGMLTVKMFNRRDQGIKGSRGHG